MINAVYAACMYMKRALYVNLHFFASELACLRMSKKVKPRGHRDQLSDWLSLYVKRSDSFFGEFLELCAQVRERYLLSLKRP